MRYWLLKTEPETWSWDNQVRKGVEPWNGVRNHQANNNLKAMQAGDRCFFYHSGAERRIVGIVEVARTWYPDPADATGKFGMVDVRTVAALGAPVTLAVIKAEPAMRDFALVRHTRLSVMPVEAAIWRRICAMGNFPA